MNLIRALCRSVLPYALALTIVLQLTACGNGGSLVGKWRKTSRTFCDALYPATVEFFNDGEYVGALPTWNGGTYRIVGAGRLRLETSTGPTAYNFELTDDTLKFRNDWGCEFSYRKEK